jgi:hypothetical protein
MTGNSTLKRDALGGKTVLGLFYAAASIGYSLDSLRTLDPVYS